MKIRGATRCLLAAGVVGALVPACATEAASPRPCSPSDPGAVEAPYTPPSPANATPPAPDAGHR